MENLERVRKGRGSSGYGRRDVEEDERWEETKGGLLNAQKEVSRFVRSRCAWGFRGRWQSVGGRGTTKRSLNATGRTDPVMRAKTTSYIGEGKDGASIHLEQVQRCPDLPLHRAGKIGSGFGWMLPLIMSKIRWEKGTEEKKVKRQTTDFRGSACCPSAVVQRTAQHLTCLQQKSCQVWKEANKDNHWQLLSVWGGLWFFVYEPNGFEGVRNII